MKASLSAALHASLEGRLTDTDALLDSHYPGDDGSRQPVHTVYVPADRYRAGLARAWGDQARELLDANGGTDGLMDALEVPSPVRAEVASRVVAKLASEPIEDLRIDLEDGYGDHGDAEDDVAVAAATTLRREIGDGLAAPFVGIRFKCFERPTRARGLRSLDLFLTELASTGPLPEGLNLTLPKVTSVAQVAAMVDVCEALETANGLTAGQLRFEVQVETPQAILDAAGTATVARMIHAGAGRVSGLHYGTFDYSASLGVAAAYQAADHPVADYAKAVMQVAAAGTGVRLSDGSTNVLPVGDRDQVRAAWTLHGRLVRRSLEQGYYQGWDMHPGHLLSRYAATYSFYREGLDGAAERLHAYVHGVEGAVMDEPATARALAWFLRRALDCGAVGAAELEERVGFGTEELSRLVHGPPAES